MEDRDMRLLAQRLQKTGHIVRVPLYRPPPRMPHYAPALEFGECHDAQVDFESKTVRMTTRELTFDEVRLLWETITLYSEVV